MKTFEQPKRVKIEKDKSEMLVEAKPKEERKKQVAETTISPRPKKSREFDSKPYPYSICDLPISFPQKLKQNKMDNQFFKFLSIFKQLYISIPLIEALEKKPTYAKFCRASYPIRRSGKRTRQ